jgi:hypothetical protein
MAIKFRKNIYNGVNAHLNSSLQNEDSAWESFCASYVVDIAVYIDKLLPTGYIAQPERSLQIHETPLSDDDYLKAVVIRKVTDKGTGEAVIRIELLVPNSKVEGKDSSQYHEKRTAALKSGIVLVEIDFLHIAPPSMNGIPSYRNGKNGSNAFWIIMLNPQPTLETGTAFLRGFQVDQNIPTIEIPLNKANTNELLVDFGSVYNQTFESLKAFSYRVDYEQLPIQFDTYSPDDQKQILAVMERAKTIAANPE